jgi:hypothetical protein
MTEPGVNVIDGAAPGDESLRRFVEDLAQNHPPLSLDAADLTIHDPARVRRRFGPVFTYLARVELEVERNVLELRTLMPRAGDIDRFFYEQVWSPQEQQHGVLLDAVQRRLGVVAAPAELSRVTTKIKVVGALTRIPGMLDIVRLLYYLTGAATERSAVVAYSRLLAGLEAMGEHAIAQTVVAPIRRQEPGHFVFYRQSAEHLVGNGLKPWQLHLARVLRTRSFAPVGVNNATQRTEFGVVAHRLGLDQDLTSVARQVSRVERELLWAHEEGLDVPRYVLRALEEATCAARESVVAQEEALD